MEDLIKRSDVWNITAILHSEFITIEQEQILERIDEMVDGLPSADRPQGEWIEIGLAFNSYKCSVCGRMLVNITNGKNTVTKSYPYCHCGAKMTGARSLRREDIRREMEGADNDNL